jgi:hypothetical protein
MYHKARQLFKIHCKIQIVHIKFESQKSTAFLNVARAGGPETLYSILGCIEIKRLCVSVAKRALLVLSLTISNQFFISKIWNELN